MLQLVQLSETIAQLSDNGSRKLPDLAINAYSDNESQHHTPSARISSRRNSSSLSTIREEPRVSCSIEPGYYLHAAVIASNVSTISYLLNNGSNPNTILRGFTPLTLCLSLHKDIQTTLSVTRQLIAHGANPNLMCPLHIACRKGLTSVVEMLLTNGASADMLEHSTGKTALQVSLMKLINSNSDSQVELYKNICLMILNGNEVDVINCGLEGASPLHLSILTHQPEIIQTVISKGDTNFSQQALQEASQLIDSCDLSSQSHFTNIISSLEKLRRRKSHLDLSCGRLVAPANLGSDEKHENFTTQVKSAIPKTTMKQQAEFLLNYL